MNRLLTVGIVLLSAAAAAVAQEAYREPLLALDREPAEAWSRVDPAGEAAATLEPVQAGMDMQFTAGLRVGYLRAPDADRGTWTGGVQARLYLLEGYLGAEASIEFHQDEFADGDIVVTTYPVQVTGLVFPLAGQKELPIQPYGLVGFGWYYTRIDYDASLGTDDETERFTGVHVGVGGDLKLGENFVLNADFRWVFVDEPGVDNSNLDEEEWDFWQATGGVSFKF